MKTSTITPGNPSTQTYPFIPYMGLFTGGSLMFGSVWGLTAMHLGDSVASLPVAIAIVFLCVFIVGVALMLYSLLARLTISTETITISVGPFRRSVVLTELSKCELRRFGYSRWYVISDQRGSTLKINPQSFRGAGSALRHAVNAELAQK